MKFKLYKKTREKQVAQNRTVALYLSFIPLSGRIKYREKKISKHCDLYSTEHETYQRIVAKKSKNKFSLQEKCVSFDDLANLNCTGVKSYISLLPQYN